MKWLLIKVVGVACVICLVSAVPQFVVTPDAKLIGTWREASWEYERVGAPWEIDRASRDTLTNAVKDQLGKHLVIHSAEVWKFRPDGTLLLQGAKSTREVHWKLKGRGHILELQYDNQMIEHYNITDVNRRELVLNYDSDMQVKGIAKLTFNRQ